ncbi:MAG: hypothetical protein U0529_07800 [Thermoanaerobaculia bacterium]
MARSAFLALLVVSLAAPVAAQQATPGQVAYVEGLRAFDGGDYGTAAARMRTALAEDPREATARFRYRAQNAEDYFPHLWLGLSLEKLGEKEGALRELGESRRQGAVDARPALRMILDSSLARVTPPTPVPTATPAPVVEPTREAPLPAPTAVLPLPTRSLPAASPAAVAVRSPASPAPTPAPGRGSGAGAVRAGLRAFFRGDYAEAERLLAPEAEPRPVARLFLAYTLGGRYLVAEPGDAALLARARSEYSAALLAGAPADAGPWVSPAILSLFGAANGAR